MATLLAKASGNLTASTSWFVSDTSTGSAQTTVTTSTSSTTSAVYSPTFTIGNGVVIDGVLVGITRLGGTGTITLSLSDNNGVSAARTVTINMSDVQNIDNNSATVPGVLIYFKFSSTLTGDGGTDYRLGLHTSTNAQASLFRGSTTADWFRILFTTTEAAPAAGDNMYIAGERTGAGASTTHTITMDSTAATDYGLMRVSDVGKVKYGIAAATNYILRLSGNLNIWGGGEFCMGDSTDRIPIDSTAVLEFDCSSDGEFVINVFGLGVFRAYGRERLNGVMNPWVRLSANEAAAQTTLSTNAQLSAKSGDTIAIAGTSLTVTHLEERTMSGDAGASDVTVTAGLTNSHLGTAPTQAHVAVLDRNVMIRSVSSSNASQMTLSYQGVLDAEWASWRYMGYGNSFNPAILVRNPGAAQLYMRYCVIRDSDGYGLSIHDSGGFGTHAHSGWIVRDLTIYKMATASNPIAMTIDTSSSTSTPWEVDGLLIMGGSNAFGAGLSIADGNGTLSNVNICNLTSAGIPGITFSTGTDGVPPVGVVIDGLEIYGCAGTGIQWSSSALHRGQTFRNFKFWHNNNVGVLVSGQTVGDILFEDGIFLGCQSTGVSIFGNAVASGWRFNNVDFGGSTSHNSANGLRFNNNGGAVCVPDWRFEACDFGVVSGSFVAHTSHDINVDGFSTIHGDYWAVTMVNCRLASATEINGISIAEALKTSFFALQNHDQSLTTTKTLQPAGTIAYESTTYDVTPALKMTPLSATTKLESNASRRGFGFLVPCIAGDTFTVSVKVRKDGSYNGSDPRFIAKSCPHIPTFSEEFVVDTLSGPSGVWDTLTGTYGPLDAGGVVEFVVDCDGTAGNVFVDTFAVTLTNNSLGLNFWNEGLPFVAGAGAVVPGTITFVDFTPGVLGGAGNTTSYDLAAFNCVAGNTVFVGIRANNVNGITPVYPLTMTDTAGNTYTMIRDGYVSFSTLSLWVCENCLGHATNVINVTFQSPGHNYVGGAVAQFSGVYGSHEIRATGFGSSSVAAVLDGAVYAPEAGLAVGFFSVENGGAWSPGSGQTEAGEDVSGVYCMNYKIFTSPGVVNLSSTHSTASSKGVVSALYDPPGTVVEIVDEGGGNSLLTGTGLVR